MSTPEPPTSNAEYLAGIFGTLPGDARPMVCGFVGNPKAGDWTGWPWSPGSPADGEGLNWYFTLAAYRPDSKGKFHRTHARRPIVHGIMLDDLGTRAPLSRLDALPPSTLVRTSDGSYQATYLFLEAETDLARVESVTRALVAKLGTDKGAKGMASRYCRLPFGVNGKTDPPKPCGLVEWHPERRYTLDQISSAFELGAVRPTAARVEPRECPTERWDSLSPEEQARTATALRAALPYLDSDDHDEWVKTGHALRSLPLQDGAPLYEEWSATSAKFQGDDDMARFAGMVPDRTDYTAILRHPRVVFAPRAAMPSMPPLPLPEIFASVALPVARPDWPTRLRVWTPRDLTLPPRPVEWAVENWIQAGKVGALVAAGGTGKTTLLLTLAICIALGRPFLGNAVKRGSFVLLSNDDTQGDLDGALTHVLDALALAPHDRAIVAAKVRIVSLHGDGGIKTFSAPGPGGAPIATGLEELIAQATAGIADLVGIALDTLRQFSGGSSNDEQVVKLAVAGATTIAQRTGAFVVVPHHTGKQNYREGITDMYAGSGSAAIADNCRFVLLLQSTTWEDITSKVQRTGRELGDPQVLLSTRGSLLVKPPPPMYLHRDGYRIERIAGTPMTANANELRRDLEILQAVRIGATSKRAIGLEVRGNNSARDLRVNALIARGLLVNEGKPATPKYGLTAAGRELLEVSAAQITAAPPIECDF